jgi:hypothetical protein
MFEKMIADGWIELISGEHIVSTGRYFTRNTSAPVITQSGGVVWTRNTSAPVITSKKDNNHE